MNTVVLILLRSLFFHIPHCLSDIDILRDSVTAFKNSTRLVTVDIFNLLRRKFFCLRKQLEVWQLVDSSPWLILLHTQFWRENTLRKIFYCRYVMPHESKLGKFLVSLDIIQHNALVIFAVKRSTISVINKKLLNVICKM